VVLGSSGSGTGGASLVQINEKKQDDILEADEEWIIE